MGADRGPTVPGGGYPVDIADETYVVAAAEELAAIVRDPASWRRWWPDLVPTVTRDRGAKGVQWAVQGALVGSMEVWLEPWGDGVVVHWYVRARPGGRVRQVDRERERRVRAWKVEVHALKDRLEAGREPGAPRVGAPAPSVKDGDEPAEST